MFLRLGKALLRSSASGVVKLDAVCNQRNVADGRVAFAGFCDNSGAMKIDRVETYPDAAFSTDSRAQQQLTDGMKRKDRCLRRLFLRMLAVFVASGIVGMLGFPMLTVAGISLMGLLLVAAMILLRLPSVECPECGMKMETDWVSLRSGRSGEFVLCRSCKIALYTHRTLR